MSSCSVENQNPNHNQVNLWLKNNLALNHVTCSATRRRSLSSNRPPTTATSKPLPYDFTSLLSDEILLQILSKIDGRSHRNSSCLVSKRWMNLLGRLVRSVKVYDWDFVISGRMFFRFPNLTHVDLVNATLVSNSNCSGTSFGVLVSHEIGSFRLGHDEFLLCDDYVLLPVDEVDFGLRVLASVYPDLRRLVVVNCSEIGLMSVAEGCCILQELVLHQCNDHVLIAIAAFPNLHTLKLVGVVDGFYRSLVSDRGLTILAQGCTRLLKLELQGCEGGYEGIKAVGECCQMLEELTFCDHRMDKGWLSALSFCESLKTLRFVSCKGIDESRELDEHLGVCAMLETLHLERCQLRDKQSVRALFLVCQTVQEVVFKNCWGLNDAIFFNATLCRRMKYASIEGCARLTTQGLETVVLTWKELESLRVISCKNIKDDDVTPTLSVVFSNLKDFKWCPGNTSFQSTRLSSSDMGKRGAKFFKKFQI
ncbi:hypothetical protein QVD17_31151 [Tagetes erecta]|uniref:F-box domain-containing protein n=1 Tax=Tagetes erecta TaxID=13708 RepID=A0AAD8K2U8_TARER|nr:hypothetical protein QVD17_31151 [Tagetes erecta]